MLHNNDCVAVCSNAIRSARSGKTGFRMPVISDTGGIQVAVRVDLRASQKARVNAAAASGQSLEAEIAVRCLSLYRKLIKNSRPMSKASKLPDSKHDKVS